MNLNFRFLFMFLFLMAGFAGQPGTSRAASYDIQELTPAVKSALDSRRERFEQVRAYKEKGVIGENNRGYVELLSEDSDAKSLVEAENRDRRLIYKAIVEQNNLASSELEKVEQAFAQVQRDKAESGDKIQDPDGQWVTK
jgi:uncharacterized protein YdbL (DUF1318 family)